jgi:hypothetical protein
MYCTACTQKSRTQVLHAHSTPTCRMMTSSNPKMIYVSYTVSGIMQECGCKLLCRAGFPPLVPGISRTPPSDVSIFLGEIKNE